MAGKQVFGAALLLIGAALIGYSALGVLSPSTAAIPSQTASQHAESTPEKTPEIAQAPLFAPQETLSIWQDWMARHGIADGAMSLMKDGQLLSSHGAGRSPERAYPLASLSKAVTAICLDRLLQESGYEWSARLADVAPVLARLNISIAAPMQDLTLGQIAVHESGLPKVVAQGKTTLRTSNIPSQSAMTRAALNVQSNFGPRGQYSYSNANYAILGSLAVALSGKPYSEVCFDKALRPAGVREATSNTRAGYGGWSMSTEDYARFATFWFAPGQAGTKVGAQIGLPEAKGYGLGAGVYHTPHGLALGHFGRWTNVGRSKLSIGAMFLVAPDGTGFVASWDGSYDHSIYRELQQNLLGVLRR